MSRILAFLYGVVAYVVFLVSFLYAIGFVGNVAVPKSIDSGVQGMVIPSVIVDAVLLSLFAIQHSGMARPGFKKWWTRVVPRPIERSTYVLLASLLLLLLFWQWRPLTAVVWRVDGSAGAAVLNALFWLGWLTVLTSTFMINHAELFGIEQVTANLRRKAIPAPRFASPALYRFVRHPIMVGFLIAFWATPLMTAGHLLFAIATTGYILVGVYFEERDLVTAFGSSYLDYRKAVPAFIPRPRHSSGRGVAGAPGAAASHSHSDR